MVTLKTERLLLRHFCSSDLDAYAEMCGDPEVMRYIGNGMPLSREDSWRNMALIVGHWQLRGYGLWAVELQETGDMVGRVGIWNPEGWPGMEVGWMLRRAYQGNGYAIEAARASLGYAFTELDQSHMISLIQPGNAASIRVAERLGEKLEGRMTLFDQEVLLYGIHRSEQTEGP